MACSIDLAADLIDIQNRQITARIPHQSKNRTIVRLFDSFPPGEALGAPAPVQRSTISPAILDTYPPNWYNIPTVSGS